MGQNLSSTQKVDTSLDSLDPYWPQEKQLLVIWLLSAYGMAFIWFIVLLCDRWERRGRTLGVVLQAMSLSIFWPLVLIYLVIAGPKVVASAATVAPVAAPYHVTGSPVAGGRVHDNSVARYHITGSPVTDTPVEDTSAAKKSRVTFAIDLEHELRETQLEIERQERRLLMLQQKAAIKKMKEKKRRRIVV